MRGIIIRYRRPGDRVPRRYCGVKTAGDYIYALPVAYRAKNYIFYGNLNGCLEIIDTFANQSNKKVIICKD